MDQPTEEQSAEGEGVPEDQPTEEQSAEGVPEDQPPTDEQSAEGEGVPEDQPTEEQSAEGEGVPEDQPTEEQSAEGEGVSEDQPTEEQSAEGEGREAEAEVPEGNAETQMEQEPNVEAVQQEEQEGMELCKTEVCVNRTKRHCILSTLDDGFIILCKVDYGSETLFSCRNVYICQGRINHRASKSLCTMYKTKLMRKARYAINQ